MRFLTCRFQSEPPVAVHDLFTDIQDGRVLMALLEQLSGCKLVSQALQWNDGMSSTKENTF